MSNDRRKRVVNLAGQRIGRWTVIDQAPNVPGRRGACWNVRCDCGTERVATANSLTSGKSNSCGCLNRQNVRAAHLTHGESNHARSSEYGIWNGMRNRCNKPNCKAYKDYGGRGITVCERWNTSFENFLADMGRRPSSKHSLERKDNNGHYSPENCVWATKYQQSRNHRRNNWLTLGGRKQTITDWARELGLTLTGLKHRLAANWSEERILETVKPATPIDLMYFVWPTA